MENTNTEVIIKEKKKRTEAMRAAQKRYNDKLKQNEDHKILQKERQKNYYNKFKDDPEFQELRRSYSKKHYDNNKDKVIERVKSYQRGVKELEQLERLYELQQEGLLDLHRGDMTEEEYDKYNRRLLNKLNLIEKEYENNNNNLLDRVAHIHLSS